MERTEVSDDKSDEAAGDGFGFDTVDMASDSLSSMTMFVSYRILNVESRDGRETAIVSELSLGGLRGGLGFNLGFFVGGSADGGSSDGDGVGRKVLEPDVDAAPVSPPLAMPLSVASLYFLIFALEIREVK